jgi:hypothetical protein
MANVSSPLAVEARGWRGEQLREHMLTLIDIDIVSVLVNSLKNVGLRGMATGKASPRVSSAHWQSGNKAGVIADMGVQ